MAMHLSLVAFLQKLHKLLVDDCKKYVNATTTKGNPVKGGHR